MIVGIHGYMGSFKTTTGVALAYLAQSAGYTIMSNQELNEPYFKNVQRLDLDMMRRYAVTGQILPYKKLFILGDEWQQVMDARRSMDNDELVNTYLITQFRKRRTFLTYMTTLRGMSDLRLRDNTNMVIKCYKRHKYEQGNKFKVGNVCFDDNCIRPHCAELYFINVIAGKGKRKIWRNPEVIYPMFDSDAIISPISHLSEKDMQEILSAVGDAGKLE